MVWPSSFPVCFYILAFLARQLSARLYHQWVYPLTADPTCSFARVYRFRLALWANTKEQSAHHAENAKKSSVLEAPLPDNLAIR